MIPVTPPSHAALAALAALKDGALVVDASTRARVRLVGADARAFVHRLSTNHVTDLGRGQGRLNALPTDKGRIVDLVLHLDRGDDGLLLVGSPGRGASLLAWLDRYLFSEKVELSDWSETGSAAEIAGGGAGALVDALAPGASALAPWAFVESGSVLVARTFDRVDATGARVPGFLVVDLAKPGITEALVEKGAVKGTDTEAEIVRVAAGAPAVSDGKGELVEKYNPLDLGLHDAIHWAKGCYIGQEVIARLDTYQKQTRRLVGLVLPESARSVASPGTQVLVDGVVAGEITSVSPASWGGLPNALAVAKLKEPEGKGVVVKIGDQNEEAVARELATAQKPHD